MTDPAATRVLADRDLDLLELALGGGIADIEALLGDIADGTVLTDAENTPLARVDERQLVALKPFARTPGPHWDPQYRRGAAELRETEAAIAVTVAEAPTRGDLDRLRAGLKDQNRPVLVIAPVARGVAAEAHVGAAGLTRAAIEVAAVLTDADVSARAVALPWPHDAADGVLNIAGLTLDDVVRGCGAGQVRAITDGRPVAEQHQVDALPAVRADAVRSLYPDACAPDVERALSATGRRGAVILFTGLSGSGKSTVASALRAELEDDGIRTTQLDGDEVRQFLSRGLGFDRASREANVERIGYVASLIALHGGVAVAAPIAPFAASRARVRELAQDAGASFLLVHISTPLDVCEARDRKGLYAKARAGEIPDFTGISSPYEEPTDADLAIDTSVVDVDDAVEQVRAVLDERFSQTR